MTVHPTPPTDLPGLVAGFLQTAQAVIELGRSCQDSDFERPTDCPGWTVKDQLSHIVAVESWLAGDPPPAVEVPDHPWLRSDFGRFMEIGVEARRRTPGSVVVAELEEVLARRAAWWADPQLTLDTQIDGPLPRSAKGLIELRCQDVWCHEQDIRGALHRPGGLDSVAAQVFTAGMLEALPFVVAKKAALPLGQVVIVELTGPITARAGARVIEVDGTLRGEPLFSGQVTGQVSGDAGDAHAAGGPTTTITLSTEAFTRRGGGRWSVEHTPYAVSGDAEVARRVLEELAFTP